MFYAKFGTPRTSNASRKVCVGMSPPTPFPQILIGLNMLCIILFMLVKLSYQTWDPWAPNASTKVCGGGGWWVGEWVCKPILVISLVPRLSSGWSIVQFKTHLLPSSAKPKLNLVELRFSRLARQVVKINLHITQEAEILHATSIQSY